MRSHGAQALHVFAWGGGGKKETLAVPFVALLDIAKGGTGYEVI